MYGKLSEVLGTLPALFLPAKDATQYFAFF